MASTITLTYSPQESRGVFSRSGEVQSSIWTRMQATAVAMDPTARLAGAVIDTQWRCALELLRLHAPLQRQLGFRFTADASAAELIERFRQQVGAVKEAAGTVRAHLDSAHIEVRLRELGWNFDRHALKGYQSANVAHLASLPNGANFSVPGAGKTTVTFALHLLFLEQIHRLLVVAPRNAFPAWEEVTLECLLPGVDARCSEPLTQLTGGENRIAQQIQGDSRRFIISYDQLVRVEPLIRELLYKGPVHLVLDESHKIKDSGGKRGRALQRLGHLAARRDILSGTPMPQSSADLQSQIDFLWPGLGLGARIRRGEPPRQVVEGLFVRTTKQDLQLEPRVRQTVEVVLSENHLMLYSVVKDDVRARASALRRGASGVALKQARAQVVRILQAAVYPELLARHVLENAAPQQDLLLRAVIAEGPSARIVKAVELARELAAQGKKVLIWTIFTASLRLLARLLSDLNPAVINGETHLGSEDDETTRQGQIRQFRYDDKCMVMIANPAAAAEGMSLHMVCHDAIYVDRSYNATHFLQSVDRIHRLGLPPGTGTTVYVLENKLPFGVGSIDVSVARRLAVKIRGLEQLLGDPDLNALALDEEDIDGLIDESTEVEDIDDMIRELEKGSIPQSSELA